jgi:four helix bundle protein
VSANSFKDLKVWKKAHEFVLAAYKISNDFPKEEVYGLTSQFRRAAVSIAANIVEGFRKRGQADKLRFYNIAQSSLEECRYYLILIKDLEYTKVSKETEMLEETSKLLNAYCKAIVDS